MKNKIIISAICLIMGLAASAQESGFGVKAGLNMANVSGDYNGDAIISFHSGVMYNIMLSDQMGLQPEALLSFQGTKYDLGLFGSANLDLMYLNIPVMFKYYATENINFQAGPQIGLLLAADGGTEGYNTLDLALGLGAAYELDGGFNVGLRYNLGLSNISENADGGNSVFQISAGYFF